MITGDVETGRGIIRNYINATVCFPKLAEKTHIPKNSLMRMFGPSGNPSATNLFGVIAVLQKQEGVSQQYMRPRKRFFKVTRPWL